MSNKKADVERKLDLMEQELKCVVCLSIFNDPHSLPCNHQFCFNCIAESIRQKSQCPLCKLPAFHRAIHKNQSLANIVTAFYNLKDSLSKFSVDNGLQLQIPSSPVTPKKLEESKRPREDHSTRTSSSKHTHKRQCQSFSPPSIGSPTTPEIVHLSNQRHKPASYTTQPTTTTAASKCKKFVILPTSLDSSDLTSVKDLVSTMGRGAMLVDKYSPSVTHVVTTCNIQRRTRRTLKYCFGILEGKWVVSVDWVRDCLKEGFHLYEEPYEIKGDHTALGAPKRGRENKENEKPLLLDGFRFHLFGNFASPSKDELKKLLISGGAEILSVLPPPNKVTPTTIILADSRHVESLATSELMPLQKCGADVVDYGWVLDSISYFELLDIREYVT